MEQVITFRIEEEDKKKIKEKARSVGLRIAPFCRNIVLKKIQEDKPKE